jgi:hypothetical protein
MGPFATFKKSRFSNSSLLKGEECGGNGLKKLVIPPDFQAIPTPTLPLQARRKPEKCTSLFFVPATDFSEGSHVRDPS